MKYRWLTSIFIICCFTNFVWGFNLQTVFNKYRKADLELLMAVGDLNFSGELGRKIVADPNYPWRYVKPILDRATILIGNLETPFSQRGKPYISKTWILKADPRTVRALNAAGFDLVTLANNHIMDYGPLALQETLLTLNQAKIKTAGAGMNLSAARRPALIKTPSGVTLAFLAYSSTYPEAFWATAHRPGTAYGNPAVFLADIKAAKARADHVIVSFHWGNELRTVPSPYQVQYAHQCIDNGASLVVGHHPHVLQGFEAYHGGLIAYSLGNFAFGSLTDKVSDSAILAVTFAGREIREAAVFPVNVQNYQVNFQTSPRYGADAVRALQKIQTLSQSFKTPIRIINGVGVIKIK